MIVDASLVDCVEYAFNFKVEHSKLQKSMKHWYPMENSSHTRDSRILRTLNQRSALAIDIWTGTIPIYLLCEKSLFPCTERIVFRLKNATQRERRHRWLSVAVFISVAVFVIARRLHVFTVFPAVWSFVYNRTTTSQILTNVTANTNITANTIAEDLLVVEVSDATDSWCVPVNTAEEVTDAEFDAREELAGHCEKQREVTEEADATRTTSLVADRW